MEVWIKLTDSEYVKDSIVSLVETGLHLTMKFGIDY